MKAYHEDSFKTVSLDDLKGKWSILFFYLYDFCFVCPTELSDMADLYGDFKDMGIEIYGISADSHFSHKAWHEISPSINRITFPLLSDKSGFLAKSLGVWDEAMGCTDRGTFLIDPECKIRIIECQEKGIGRNAEAFLRKISSVVTASCEL